MKIKQYNFFYLLGGLLITLLIAPAVDDILQNVLNFAFIGTVLVGVWSLQTSKRIYKLGWVLVGLAVIINITELYSDEPWIFVLSILVYLAFCILSIVFTLQRVLFADEIDANRIAGAVCVYLLLGISWSLCYYLIYHLDAQAFHGVAQAAVVHAEQQKGLIYDFIYYSFVTLTTLGYGEITPVHKMARALAYLEATAGVMYVAVLVAALVGTYSAQRKKPKS